MIIYRARNKVNGKCYIGQTRNTLNVRRSGHYSTAKQENPSMMISMAIKKYGRENFVWDIIEECKSLDELDKSEIRCIKEYNSMTPNGYNILPGGNTMELINLKKKDRQYTLRMGSEEFKMVEHIRLNSSVSLPKMLRQYIRDIYDELTKKKEVNIDDNIYGGKE